VATGAGYAILNVRPAMDHSYDGNKVICLPIADTVQSATIVLAVMDGANMTRRVNAFIHSTVECMKGFKPELFRWIEQEAAPAFNTDYAAVETPPVDTQRTEIVGIA